MRAALPLLLIACLRVLLSRSSEPSEPAGCWCLMLPLLPAGCCLLLLLLLDAAAGCCCYGCLLLLLLWSAPVLTAPFSLLVLPRLAAPLLVAFYRCVYCWLHSIDACTASKRLDKGMRSFLICRESQHTACITSQG
jgi:hypothetical protein